MANASEPPSVHEVLSVFDGLIAGTVSRDDADRWACRFVAADDAGIDDDVVWRALCRLSGIDLRHGEGLDYLYDDSQIQDWRSELARARHTDRR
jgi:hypothetical protein